MRSSPAPQERTLGLAAVIVGVVILATASSIVKWSEQPGPVVGVWRLGGAAIIWWAILIVRHRRRGRPYPSGDAWRLSAPAGLAFGANVALVFTGITKTSVVHAEFIITMSPLLLIPAGALFFRERPNWRALSFGTLSIIGIAIVLGNGPSEGTATLTGDLFVVAGLFTWTAYLLTTKRARLRVDVVDFMACAMPVAAVTCLPIAIATEQTGVWSMSGRGWFVAIALAVLTGVVAHGLIVVAQRHVAVATIGIIQTGQPAMAAVWAFLLLGEEIRPAQLPGMALVLMGIALFTWSTQRGARRVARSAASGPSPADTRSS